MPGGKPGKRATCAPCLRDTGGGWLGGQWARNALERNSRLGRVTGARGRSACMCGGEQKEWIGRGVVLVGWRPHRCSPGTGRRFQEWLLTAGGWRRCRSPGQAGSRGAGPEHTKENVEWGRKGGGLFDCRRKACWAVPLREPPHHLTKKHPTRPSDQAISLPPYPDNHPPSPHVAGGARLECAYRLLLPLRRPLPRRLRQHRLRHPLLLGQQPLETPRVGGGSGEVGEGGRAGESGGHAVGERVVDHVQAAVEGRA
eukprot:scaffold11332_cov94-Isochrysis_galbana.AAC.2